MPARIREIIRQYFDNDYPNRLQKEFISWINNADNKVEKEAAFRSIWDELDITAGQSTEKSFETLQEKIRVTSTAASENRFFMRKLLRVAAILALPLLSAAVTYWAVNSSKTVDDNLAFIECIVPDGEIRTVTLPDSSVVKVNSGSILIYPSRFAGSRDIYLNGEAYFTVAKNEAKPFVVKTSGMDIEALGTVFNVSAYTDSEDLSTSLESGKVSVRFKDTDEESMLLLPGEQVTYGKNSGSIRKKTVKIENVIAWINGNTVIQSMPVNEVIKIIERKYAVNIYFDPEKYRNERITIRVAPEESVADFMTVLKYLIPSLKYRIENDNIFIY